jgi:ketosteroid isomerase-like protein
MPTPDAKAFSQKWVDAWNAHDVEAVLEQFRDDVVSPHPSRRERRVHAGDRLP